MTTYLFLKWAHLIAMAYWLGGEWGVMNAARPVTDKQLSLGERRRHMEIAFRIDILPRAGIILLLPLGLHMGAILNVQPLQGAWIVGIWMLVIAWLAIAFAALSNRGTDLGAKLTRLDDAILYVVMALLVIFGVYSFVSGWPFTAPWYAAKTALYGLALIVGLTVRIMMRSWVDLFREIAAGSNPQAEAKLDRQLALVRRLAHANWVIIAIVAYLGVAKPLF